MSSVTRPPGCSAYIPSLLSVLYPTWCWCIAAPDNTADIHQTDRPELADARLSTIAMIGLATMHLVTLLAAILTRIRTCRWQCQSAVFYKERKRERSRGFISGNGLQEPLRKAPPHAGVHQLLSVCNWRFSCVARCRPENMSTIDILTGVYNNYWRQFN